MNMTILTLKILLALVIVQSLVKFAFIFLVNYETRRRMLDSQSSDKITVTKRSDILMLGMVVLLLILLVTSGQIEYISFGVGLYVVGVTQAVTKIRW